MSSLYVVYIRRHFLSVSVSSQREGDFFLARFGGFRFVCSTVHFVNWFYVFLSEFYRVFSFDVCRYRNHLSMG